MEKEDIAKYFSNILENKKDVSIGIATMMTLLEVLKHDESKTVQEMDLKLKAAGVVMRNTDYPITAVSSACELFMRFITQTNLDLPTFGKCREIMVKRGEHFLKTHQESRTKIAEISNEFIKDGQRILTHSKSRVVFQALVEAANSNKRIEVFVTAAAIDNSGVEMYQALQKASIESTLILDSAVGYIMEQVVMVLVGAGGVALSGGIINKIGTFTMTVCAKEMKKDFYVLAESFKIVKEFPLNQRELSNKFKYPSSKLQSDLSKEHPLVDYTPPTYLTLLFTDLGILTSLAVSDKLLQIYM